MSNTHTIADTMAEIMAREEDLLPACVISTTWPTVPVSSMTLAAFTTQAYIRDGQHLVYADQPAITLTLSGSAGTYWLAISRDVSTAYATWTRRAGSHYLWQLAGARPPDVDGLLVFASVTVAGGVITAVTPAPGVTRAERWRTLAGLGTMATQDANAVAVTGGTLAVSTLGTTATVQVGTDLTVFGEAGLGIAPDPAYSLKTFGAAQVGGLLTCVGGLLVGGTVQLNNTVLLSSTLTVQELTTLAALTVNGASQMVGNLDIASNLTVFGKAGFGIAPDAAYSLRTFADAQVGGNLSVVGTARTTNLGLGIPPTADRIATTYDRAATNAINLRPTVDTGPGSALYFQNAAGGNVGSITTTASATAYNTASDVRLKHAITALAGALDVVAALRPVRFRWNADDSVGHGFLAHELQALLPEAVSGQPDEVNEDGSVRPQQVDHSKLVPWLTAALQEAVAQVQALAARVASLEEQLGI